MRRRVRSFATWLLFLAACVLLISAGRRYVLARSDPLHWVRVVRDANYEIALDTSRLARRDEWWSYHRMPAFEVWYRTDHALPRLHNGKEFRREVVQSSLQCDSLWFKVASVDMIDRAGKLVVQQRLETGEVRDQHWRRVERGTAEEMAAAAACHFASQRFSQTAAR